MELMQKQFNILGSILQTKIKMRRQVMQIKYKEEFNSIVCVCVCVCHFIRSTIFSMNMYKWYTVDTQHSTHTQKNISNKHVLWSFIFLLFLAPFLDLSFFVLIHLLFERFQCFRILPHGRLIRNHIGKVCVCLNV